jgi:hypothetical protein
MIKRIREFRVHPAPIITYATPPGQSAWTAHIPILVNDEPPRIGMVGPGITVSAPTKGELDELYAWVIEKLGNEGSAEGFG